MLAPIRILVERAPSGLLIASSPDDLPGLHVMERTEAELMASLRELIPVLYAEKGEKIAVTRIVDFGAEGTTDPCPWVVAGVRPAMQHVGSD